MKKLLVAMVFAAALPAHAIIGNIGHSTSLDFAKAVVPESIEKLFINVKANGALVAGQLAAWDLTADDGATVVSAPTSGLAPACVVVAAIADGALGKCQVYGAFDSALFDAGNNTTIAVTASVAGKRAWISTGNAGYIAARGAEVATEIPVGFFFDAASSSGSVQLFIKL